MGEKYTWKDILPRGGGGMGGGMGGGAGEAEVESRAVLEIRFEELTSNTELFCEPH